MAETTSVFTIKDLSKILDSPLLALLDNICEGSIIVDDHARCLWISDKYRKVLDIDTRLAVRGLPVEELIPNSMMRQVVRSGQPILLDLLRARKTWMVVTRIPIRDADEQVIGGIGFVFYRDMDYLKSFVAKYGRLSGLPSTAERELASMRETTSTRSLTSWARAHLSSSCSSARGVPPNWTRHCCCSAKPVPARKYWLMPFITHRFAPVAPS